MRKDVPENTEVLKEKFNELSKRLDSKQGTFEGKLDRELEWERLLKNYLPENKDAKVLDAGGGTGRMTLSLAGLGYQVTLSDLSSGMLSVARKKLKNARFLSKVEIREADLTSLPFQNEVFDLVVCLHGPICNTDSVKAAKELTRVMKKGAIIIVDSPSRYWAAAREVSTNPDLALKLLKSEVNYAYDVHGDWQRVFSPEEFTGLFEVNGIKTLKTFGSFYHLLPDEIKSRREWPDSFFSKVVEVMTYMRDLPTIIGMARELTLVGEKI